MKYKPEQELDLVIDTFNLECDPLKDHYHDTEEKNKEKEDRFSQQENEQNNNLEANDDRAEMAAIVRTVRIMKQPAEPNSNFEKRLYTAIGIEETSKVKGLRSKKAFFRLTATAAGLVLVLMFTFWNGLFKSDVVYAMEQALLQLSSYHGVFEVSTENMSGDKWLVKRVEIWSEGEKYALRQDDGILTVNNGEIKWQLRADKKELALLSLVPDNIKGGFDLQYEGLRAKKYPHALAGKEDIAGREALKLKISPPGGEPYHIWIDIETNLPLQLQTAVQNALQTTYTFIEFHPNIQIDPKVFQYEVPEGFKVTGEESGQLVNSINEAITVSGIIPVIPQEAPMRIYASDKRIALDYGDTTIVEVPAQETFKPASYGALGEINGKPLEIIREQLRWQQQGLEIVINGSRSAELAQQIAPGLILPNKDADISSRAAVKVPVDIEIVKADQKQVDGGHTPWQLDPLSVTLTFVNLMVTPEGINGEPQIPYSAFEIGNNTGVEVIVEVAQGPVSKVYLKRLVRQDESGIWTVVGYDPR